MKNINHQILTIHHDNLIKLDSSADFLFIGILPV